MAAPLKRETTIREAIRLTHDVLVDRAEDGADPVQAEVTTEGSESRLVVIYSRRIAESQRGGRHARLGEFRELVDRTIERVEGEGARRLSSEAAFRRFVAELTRRKTSAYFLVGFGEDGTVEIQEIEDVHRYPDKCDGKLVLVLETSNWTLAADELEQTYRDLQEIERSFRSLKSGMGIRPTFHWTERRVRAHVFLCVLGLLVEHMMRIRLRSLEDAPSPERALEQLAQLTKVTLEAPDETRLLLANRTRTPEQKRLFDALGAEPLTPKRLREACRTNTESHNSRMAS